LWFQPFYGNLSFNAITEVPFSVLFVTAGLLFAYRRYSAAAFCVGLLPLIRYEGAALIGVVIVLSVLARRWRPIVFAMLPLVVQNGVTLLVLGQLPFQMFLHPSERWLSGQQTAIGAAVSPFGFMYRFQMLPQLAGIPLILLVIVGLPHLFRRKDQAVIFGCYLLYFSVHVIITWLALYGEQAGDLRYMLPLAPGLAMVAVVGLASAVQSLGAAARGFAGRTAMVTARVGAISLCALVVAAVGLRNAMPAAESAEQIAIRQATDWVRAHQNSENRMVSTDAWFYYMLPDAVDTRDLWLQTHDVRTFPAGTLAVWDSKYSESYGLPLSALESSNWRQVYGFSQPLSGNPAAHFDVKVFEKQADASSRAEIPQARPFW
jgi:hypothetical protein